MYLTSLTINGFKSFAKKGELSFSTPITAIVGPNGSGKSNVAESFRFVLGEQSIKSMRGKKGEDLIFNGSEGVSRLNRASVTIALNNPIINGKRVFPLDFEEITIERAVHRDGENEYLINGAKTRLKDVQELLAAANIGPTGHHIISQGEADRILSANARERREMIEDALGLKVYQFKKAESERKLKKTRENILQVESLRREVAPHLKFLEKQVKKIERSIELQEELKSVYAEYLVREDSYIAFHHDALTARRHEPTVRLEEVRKALIHAKEVLARETKDEKRDELLALESSMSEVRKRRHDITRTIGQIEGQVLFLTRRIETAKEKASKATGSPIPYVLLEENTRNFESQIERVLQSNDLKEMGRVLRDIVHALKHILKNAQSGDFAHDTKEEERELDTLEQEKSAQEKALGEVSKEEESLRVAYESLKVAIDADRSHTRDMEHERTRLGD
jgi:chromosome segregation protein